jgi:osmotically-inducible protein OsmY
MNRYCMGLLAGLLALGGCAQKTPPTGAPVPAAATAREERPDEVIGREVRQRLNAESSADFGSVVAVVSGGEVTLRGSVPSVMAAWRAEAATRAVAGVKQVHNNLFVRARGY